MITFHCSATAPWMACSAALIKEWHVGQGWSDIGYHFVIEKDGTVVEGRPLTKTGAHVGGHNKDNIGICYVGGLSNDKQPIDDMNGAQHASAVGLLRRLQKQFNIPDDKVFGHCDFPGVTKTCPNFDVKAKFQLGE